MYLTFNDAFTSKNKNILLLGTEHQELQEPAMADIAGVQQPASPATNRHPSAEQPHGAVVSHALPHADCVLLTY